MQNMTPAQAPELGHAINEGCNRAFAHLVGTSVPMEILRQAAAEHCINDTQADVAVREAEKYLREGVAELPAWWNDHCARSETRSKQIPGSFPATECADSSHVDAVRPI